MPLKMTVSLAAALALIACAPPANDDDDDAPGDLTPSTGDERQSYPASGFGAVEGAILADLDFLTVSGESWRMSDVYRNPRNKLLLVTTTAGWCTACIEEQPALQELHNRYAADGLFIVVSIFEDENFQAADPELAEKWRDRFDLTLQVVADPTFSLADYYDSNLTPMNMLVDVETMEIIRIGTGWDQGVINAIVEARL